MHVGAAANSPLCSLQLVGNTRGFIRNLALKAQKQLSKK